MNRHRTTFKDTQLFDWEAEPSLEPSSSFFYPDELTAAQADRARRRLGRQRTGGVVTLMGSVAVLGLAFAMMIELAPWLQRLCAGL